VQWRQADAMQLPFDDATFDAVACQFGVMFFPDKAKAFGEARRVLRPGGLLVFNVWDRIEENEFADAVTTALAAFFPADPPRFMARTPHGYHDVAAVTRDLRAGGFDALPRIDTIAARSRLLPGHAVAQRDRGARSRRLGRGHRRRGPGHRRPVRPRSGRRQDPGACRHRRVLMAACSGTLGLSKEPR
jgi:SAM-dependent methyltransferase